MKTSIRRMALAMTLSISAVHSTHAKPAIARTGNSLDALRAKLKAAK